MNKKDGGALDDYLAGKTGRFYYLKRKITALSKVIFLKTKSLKNVKFRKSVLEVLPMTFFVMVACYVAYRMEDNNDSIKKKLQINKSNLKEKAELEERILREAKEDPTNPNYNRQIKELVNNRSYLYEILDEDSPENNQN